MGGDLGFVRHIGFVITLACALDAVADADRLAVAELFLLVYADARVGVVLKMGHCW
jgi:hypothetical protein